MHMNKTTATVGRQKRYCRLVPQLRCFLSQGGQPPPATVHPAPVPRSLCRTRTWINNICWIKTLFIQLQPPSPWSTVPCGIDYSILTLFGVSTSAPLPMQQTAHWVLITLHWRELDILWICIKMWLDFPSHQVWAEAQAHLLASSGRGILLARCHCHWNMSFSQMFLIQLGTNCSFIYTETYTARHKVPWSKKNNNNKKNVYISRWKQA